MPDESLMVRKIKAGTVLDHIRPGNAMKILSALGLAVGNQRIMLGINMTSSKMGKKDILKVEDWMISPEDLLKLALISPGATANTIENSRVVKKTKAELPERLVGVLKCTNENCITNSGEQISTEFATHSDAEVTIVCKYCGRRWLQN